MTPGVLRLPVINATAICGPRGWSSANQGAMIILSQYPVRGTAVGVGWIKAFWAAVHGESAEVITEPKAPFDPSVVY